MKTDNPDAITEYAGTLIELNRLAEAIALLKPAVSQWPDDAYLWGQLAQASLMELINEKPGLIAVERALELDSESEWLHRLHSWALRRNGNCEAAEKAARTAIRIAPHYWPAYSELVYLLGVVLKRTEEAFAYAHKAVELAPEQAGPHLSLGRLYQETEQWAEAEEQLQIALEIDPHDMDALDLLANIQSQQGKLAEALENYGLLLRNDLSRRYLQQKYQDLAKYRAIQEAANNADHPAVAKVLISAMAFAHPAAAVSVLESALNKWPTDSSLWKELSDVLRRLGRAEEAAAAADKIIYLGDDSFSGGTLRSAALGTLDRTDEMNSVISKIRQDSELWSKHPQLKDLLLCQPNRLEELIAKATLYLLHEDKTRRHVQESYEELTTYLIQKQNDVKNDGMSFTLRKASTALMVNATEAVALLEMAVDAYPDEPEILCQLAMALVQTGQVTAGIQIAQQAIEFNSDYDFPQRVLSLGFELLGRLDEAESTANRAIELDATNWRNHDRLADLLSQIPDHLTEALAAAKQARQAAPNEPTVYFRLGKLILGTDNWRDAEQYLPKAKNGLFHSAETSKLLFMLKQHDVSQEKLLTIAYPPVAQQTITEAMTKYQSALKAAPDWQSTRDAYSELTKYLESKKLP